MPSNVFTILVSVLFTAIIKWIPLQCHATEENAPISSGHVVTEEPAWLIYIYTAGLNTNTPHCIFRVITTIRNYYFPV